MPTLRTLLLLLTLALLSAGCAGTEEGDLAGLPSELVESASALAEEAESAANEAMNALADASVSFVSPEDGATVTSPVTVEAQAEGVTIEAAGSVNEGAGHLHVVIDEGCVPAGEVIPTGDAFVHLGDGSTTTELELESGEHELCLQLGDGAHVATDVTETITVTVE